MSGIDPEMQLGIERFLLDEAALLEEGRFEEWLDLLTDDVRYVMPVRRLAQPKTPQASVHEGFALYDDDKASLTLRIERLRTGKAHAEVPPSVTQRLVTKIRVEHGAGDGTVTAHSRFFVYQERQGRHSATFVGKRRDVLKRAGASWKISERHIELAQTILPATISLLF